MEKLANPVYSKDRTCDKFMKVLNADIIDLEQLRSLSWLGIPTSCFEVLY